MFRYLFSRNKWGYFFAKLCSISYVANSGQDLFFLVGGKNPHGESGFFEENIERELVWLDNVLVCKQGSVFSKLYGMYRQIFKYDSTKKSSFVQVTDS